MKTSDLFQNELYSSQEEISDYTLEDQVIFNRSKTLSGFKKISNCTFKKGALFNNISGSGKIEFTNCDFYTTDNSSLEIGTNSVHHITFHDCNFLCDVQINTSGTRSFSFIKCGFDKSILIGSLHTITFILIKDCVLKSIYFNKVKFGSLKIDNAQITEMLSFDSVNIQSIKIIEGIFNSINFRDCEDFTSLKIENNSFDRGKIKIKELNIPNINLSGNILIQGATIDKYNISPFNNEKGRFKHQNIAFNEEVIMMDSDLSDVQFNEIDFSPKKLQLCLDNSYLSDTIFSNILWPLKKVVTHYSDTFHFTNHNDILNWKTKNKREKALIKKEIYRQLKNSSKAESNNIDALDFYRNEMASYWEYIKGNKEIKWTDRVLIRISKLVGNFGLSYTRPLLGILIFQSVFFIILVLFNYQELCFDCRPMTLGSLEKGVGEYFYLLNPLHKLKAGMTGWEILLDFLLRVFNGFFIYHFIRATRKFAKL